MTDDSTTTLRYRAARYFGNQHSIDAAINETVLALGLDSEAYKGFVAFLKVTFFPPEQNNIFGRREPSLAMIERKKVFDDVMDMLDLALQHGAPHFKGLDTMPPELLCAIAMEGLPKTYEEKTLSIFSYSDFKPVSDRAEILRQEAALHYAASQLADGQEPLATTPPIRLLFELQAVKACRDALATEPNDIPRFLPLVNRVMGYIIPLGHSRSAMAIEYAETLYRLVEKAPFLSIAQINRHVDSHPDTAELHLFRTVKAPRFEI